MAFFDELGKKLTQATQSAKQKGKEIADVTKLTFAISEEEKKLDDLYKKIGKLFVEKVGDRSEGEFLPLVNAVHEGVEKLDSLKAQKNELKGVMVCASCGTELPRDAVFCNNCGVKVAPDAPATEDTPVAEEAPATEDTSATENEE